MYSFERSSTNASRGNGGVDELDQLLSGFFRAELPHPWPAFRRAGATSRPATVWPSRWFRARSHLALAATVALLILGSLVFSGTVPLAGTAPIDPQGTSGIQADERENKGMVKDEKAREDELKPRVEDEGILYFEGQGSSTRTITITAPDGK